MTLVFQSVYAQSFNSTDIEELKKKVEDLQSQINKIKENTDSFWKLSKN